MRKPLPAQSGESLNALESRTVGSTAKRSHREVVGTQTLTVPGYSCEGSIQGALRWQIEFVGLEKVTVPAGTFDACRFQFGRKDLLQTACGQATGSGQAADPLILWAVEGLGIVKTSNPNDGSTVELAGY